jgi:ATP-dependent Clp protease ATP-binding subunit ClpC
MDSSSQAPVPENGPELEEMPAELRAALHEVHAAVEVLKRDHQAAVTELAFERAAGLRERADTLKRRKEKILREWQQMTAPKSAESSAAPEFRGE